MDSILAGHTNTYHTYSLDQALEGIARAGYRYVELSAVPGWTDHVPVDSSHQELDALRRKLGDLGLQASALSGHGGPEEALTERAGVEHAKKAIRLAHLLGVPVMNTAIGGHSPDVAEDETAFLSTIGEIGDEAAKHGIKLGLEIHGALMASGEQSADLIEKIGHPSVGINYDTANVTFYSGKQAHEDLVAALPYLVHLHLKDTVGGQGVWNFPAVGRGVVRWDEVFHLLDGGGYRGPFSVEIEFQGEPWPPLEEVNAAMTESYRFLTRFISSGQVGTSIGEG